MKINTISYDTVEFLLQYWQDIGTPLARNLSEALIAEDWKRLTMLIGTVDNAHIKDPHRLLKARLAVDIIKKADYLPFEIDTTAEAFRTWLKAEEQCRRTNLFLRAWRDYISDGCVTYNNAERAIIKSKLFQLYLPKIRKVFRRLLGEYPSQEFFDFFGGFGPGATLSNTRRFSSVLHKLSATPTITSDAVWFHPAFPKRLRTLWGDESQLSVELAGRLAFVPKSYKTDRPIMVEPLVNASIQRFLGKYLRKRLLNGAGINLSTAPNLHCILAEEGSRLGNWATIDLSSASDTIAKELVRYLMDDNWYRVFSAARTPRVDLSDAWDLLPERAIKFYGVDQPIYELEKFSSMGNGFTFELETMIFYSIAFVAAQETGCSVGGVYGDDIIVGTAAVPVLYQLLDQLGFTVNLEKSYYTGSFRESCGGDYCKGYPVKGVTLKTEPHSVWDWYSLHNRIWAKTQDTGLEGCFASTLAYIRKRVPKKWRLTVPSELGDVGFHGGKPTYVKTVNGIHYYRCLVPTTRYQRGWEDCFTPEVQLAAGLLGGVASNARGRLQGPPLMDVKSCKLAWVPLS